MKALAFPNIVANQALDEPELANPMEWGLGKMPKANARHMYRVTGK